MIFLTQADIEQSISTDQLSIFLKGNLAKLDTLEQSQIQFMSSYLSGKYDVDVIFDKDANYGSKQLIIQYLSDLIIYRAAKTNLNPRNIPEDRKDSFDEAVKELEKWATDKLNPGLPLKDAEQKSTVVKLGGNPKTTRRNW